MEKKLVVIGGTAAGLSAASKAKRINSNIDITVYEKSGYVSYGACGLPYFVGDVIKSPDDLISLTVDDLNNKKNIRTYTHHEVTEIDREKKEVTVLDMKRGVFHKQTYDYLVMATGANPIIPSIPGISSAGVHYLRTVEDGISIKERVKSGLKRAIIIGGGFIGLEVAEELRLSGIEVEIFEAMPRLLPSLNREYADEIKDVLKRNGIKVHLNSMISEVLVENGRASGVMTVDGNSYDGDLVLVSIGVLPNSDLARDCGLELGLKNGIVVDDAMQTSDPSIWACGDCVQMKNLLTGNPTYIPLGTTANKQGRITGGNIAGEPGIFKGVLGSQVTKVFDLYIASTGLSLDQAKAEGFDAFASSITKGDRASYYPGSTENKLTLIFDRDSGRLLGAQGIGGISISGRMNVLVAAISMGMTVMELNELDLVYSPSVAPVYDPILIAASQTLKLVSKEAQ